MKTNILTFTKYLAILTLALFMSCDDFLEVAPESSWDIDNFYKSEVEVEMALAGIYSQFASSKLYGNSIINFDSGTDEGYYNRRYSDGWPVGLYRHTPADDDIKDFWTTLYSAVNLTNLFEAKLDKDIFTAEEYDRFLGEAQFLRAFAYFQLVKWFGDVPMPLSYSEDLSANHLAATPTVEVYEQIIKDLSFAAKSLYHPSTAEYVPGRAHSLTAHGILARVYITMAGYPLNDVDKYELARAECDTVMSDGYHSLTVENDSTGYRSLFLNYIQDVYNTKESLFEISFSYLREQGIDAHGSHGNINGLSFAYGGTDLGYPQAYAMLSASPVMSLLYDEEGDRREEWNIPGMTYSKEGELSRTNELNRSYCPGKFRRWEPADYDDLDVKMTEGEPEPYILLEKTTTPTKNFTPINFPILRYADILLMFAEADNYIEKGPSAKAIDCLNQVRQRAGLDLIELAKPDVVTSEAAFFDELVDERAREFCFEGIRKMDLVRWELLEEKLEYLDDVIRGHSEFSDTNADHVAFLRSSTYFDITKHLLLPYPLQEVEINQLLEQKEEWK